MKHAISILIYLIVYSNINAADKKEYPVSEIPVHLLENADVVVRMETTKFDMISLDKSTLYTKKVITILNEKGDRYASFIEWYDKIRKIESFSGSLFDALGNKIKVVKKSDIQDLSATDESSLVDDNRIKAHNFYYKIYPYTIAYETEITYNGSFNFPRWIPIKSEKIAIEHSNIEVSTPSNYQLRHLILNLSGKLSEQVKEDRIIYRYELRNRQAIFFEPISPDWLEYMPSIIFNPTDFKLDGYAGNFSSWRNLGIFQWNLNIGKDLLPASTISKIHSLTDHITDTRERVHILYQYLQKNTRYISVQLGIGGMQPFDATYVATNKYGDCKALANFMYSLLKEVGIPSHYTLIRAGEDEKFCLPNFPTDFFNHIILAVPMQQDTIWLECTSQTLKPGYLGDFTEDRHALIVTSNGGILVKTPKYNFEDNLQIRNVTVNISETGNAQINTSTRFRALAQDDIHGLINALSKEKVKNYLNKSISLPDYDLVDFNYEESKSALPTIVEQLAINAANFATITGKRMFITPNLFNKTGWKFAKDSARKQDFLLKKEYTDIDSIKILIPNGYIPELLPSVTSIESQFGKFSSVVTFKDNILWYYRKHIRYSGKFAAKDYDLFVNYCDQIYKSDRRRVVFIKN